MQPANPAPAKSSSATIVESSLAPLLDEALHGLRQAPLAVRAFVVASWALCVVAVALVAARPARFTVASTAYRARLLRPWRLVTFAFSAAVFTLGAPYMGDPTWDRVVGALMSGFTYLLAPWTTGMLYRIARRRESKPVQNATVAVAGWLLAASACYETYLLFRDGRLPPTTWSNLVTSTAAFFAAGLFWSLTHVKGRGVVFAFMLDDWPKGEEERRIAPGMVLFALLLTIVIALMLWPFVAAMR